MWTESIDRCRTEEDMHLLSLFKKNAEEGKVLDLIDKHSEDIRSNEEVLNMIKMVAWCLQSDFAKRPSISMVVKVLKGVTEAEHNLNYETETLAKFHQHEENPLLDYCLRVLSEPR